MPPSGLRPGLGVCNSLPEEVTADERKPLARHICLKIEWCPNIEGHGTGDIAWRLTIDQECIAMLLRASWSERLINGIGGDLLVFDAAWLCIMTSDTVSQPSTEADDR